MTDYITGDEFKARHRITSNDKDTQIAEHVTAASREVDSMCGRQFGPHTGAATARYFRPYSCDGVRVDDCYDITEVAIDLSDTGTYTAIATTDYVTEPLNGIGANDQAGWPASRILLITTTYQFPQWRRPSVKVTAKWGWEAIPADVKEATYLLTNRLMYEVGVPSGTTPPNIEFGLPGSPLQRPYTPERLLRDYVRREKKVGVA